MKFLRISFFLFLFIQFDYGFNVILAQTSSIIYTHKVLRNASLHVINIDGSNDLKITSTSAADSGPSYSPDGKFIVFNSERNGWWKIWKMLANGTEFKQVTNPKNGADYDPNVSPNGKFIAYTSSRDNNEEIYIKEVDKDSAPVNLTNSSGNQRYPRWISDDEIIYYDTSSEYHEILITNLNGYLVKRFELGMGNNYMGDLSKNGDLVFTSDRDSSNDLYILYSDQESPIKITESNSLIDYRAKWSPEGDKIVFERSDRKTNSQIWVYDLNSKATTQITNSGYNYYPSWVIETNKKN